MNKVAHGGFLITVIVLFSLKGDVVVATPLVIEFYLIFLIGILSAKLFGLPYRYGAVVGFNGSSNHFEIAIAATATVWGLALHKHSRQLSALSSKFQ